MKKSSLPAQAVKRTHWEGRAVSEASTTERHKDTTHLFVVEIQYPTPPRIHLLMAAASAAHGQRGVHVHVVTSKIQADQALEQDCPGGFRDGEEDEQTGRRTAVRHHVQHGAEARGLLEVAGGVAIEGVEQAADGVEEAAAARVQRHVVERADGQDNAEVACSSFC